MVARDMGNRLFVGNLSWEASEGELRSFLGDSVTGVKIINDRETGRSRGFGFVETESSDAAADIIAQFDGRDFMGRELRINEAHDRPQRSSGGYGGDRGGGRPEHRDGGGGGGKRGKRRRRGGDGYGDDFGGGY
jgi:RNA recognition motif-containing protein